MTTFPTPFGRYMYRRLPFGICHVGDDYSRRVSAVFDDLPNCRRIIEDILIFSETYEVSSTYEHHRDARIPWSLPTDGQLLSDFTSYPPAACSPPQEKLPVGMEITPRILLQ